MWQRQSSVELRVEWGKSGGFTSSQRTACGVGRREGMWGWGQRHPPPTLCWASCLLRVCKQRPPVLRVLFFQPAMPVAVSYHSAPFHFPALLPSHPLLLSFPLRVPSRPPPQTLLHRTASQSQIQDSAFHYIRETKNDNET